MHRKQSYATHVGPNSSWYVDKDSNAFVWAEE